MGGREGPASHRLSRVVLSSHWSSPERQLAIIALAAGDPDKTKERERSQANKTRRNILGSDGMPKSDCSLTNWVDRVKPWPVRLYCHLLELGVLSISIPISHSNSHFLFPISSPSPESLDNYQGLTDKTVSKLKQISDRNCQAQVRSPKVQSPKVKTKGTWADTKIPSARYLPKL